MDPEPQSTEINDAEIEKEESLAVDQESLATKKNSIDK